MPLEGAEASPKRPYLSGVALGLGLRRKGSPALLQGSEGLLVILTDFQSIDLQYFIALL